MKRVYECEVKDYKRLEELLKKEPYAEKSFSKYGYKLKDGKVIGESANKYYLYLEGDEELFSFAEKKLSEISIKRAEKEVEEKVIRKIEEEENKAEEGFGAIFG